MWAQTGRLAGIWVRVTLALVTGVAVVVAVYGLGSTQMKLAALVAVVLELVTVRRLCREWSWQARGAWWRFW
jgi:hypothetical protein